MQSCYRADEDGIYQALEPLGSRTVASNRCLQRDLYRDCHRHREYIEYIETQTNKQTQTHTHTHTHTEGERAVCLLSTSWLSDSLAFCNVVCLVTVIVLDSSLISAYMLVVCFSIGSNAFFCRYRYNYNVRWWHIEVIFNWLIQTLPQFSEFWTV